MKQSIIVALAMFGLVACGPGLKVGGGKQGAAEAFAAVSAASKAGADKSATPIDLTGSVTWKCPQGGTASLDAFHFNLTTGGGSADVDQSFTINYKDCGAAKVDVGVAIANGSFTVAQKIKAGSGSADLSQTFKGKVTLSGAFDDFVEVDVAQTVSASALGTGGGMISMKLKGSITDTEGTYSYDEDLNVNAGTITVNTVKK